MTRFSRKSKPSSPSSGREDLESWYRGSSGSRIMNSRAGFLVVVFMFAVLLFLMFAPPTIVEDFDFTIEFLRNLVLRPFGK